MRLTKPGVLTVRPGFEIANDQLTGKAAIVVTVNTKRASLPKADLPPDSIARVPVDVREATADQRLRAHDPATAELASAYGRPENKEPMWDYEREMPGGPQARRQAQRDAKGAGLSDGNQPATVRALRSLYIQLQYIEASKGSGDYDTLLRAIAGRVAAGVDVRLIESAKYGMKWAEKMKQSVKQSGVDLTQNIRLQPNVHNKGFAVDARQVVISSQNFSPAGIQQNRDAGVIIASKTITAYYEAVLVADWETRAKPFAASPPNQGAPKRKTHITVPARATAARTGTPRARGVSFPGRMNHSLCSVSSHIGQLFADRRHRAKRRHVIGLRYLEWRDCGRPP